MTTANKIDVNKVKLEEVAEMYHGGVVVVNMRSLIKALNKTTWKIFMRGEIEEAVREWGILHKAHYYARYEEEFNMLEAIKQTQRQNKVIVVVENLS